MRKRSHFPPLFFFNPSLRKEKKTKLIEIVCTQTYKKSRLELQEGEEGFCKGVENSMGTGKGPLPTELKTVRYASPIVAINPGCEVQTAAVTIRILC